MERKEKCYNSKIGIILIKLYMSPNLVRMGCKTHILHYSIRDCYISFSLKTQYILPHTITFQ